MSKSYPAELVTAFSQKTCRPYFAVEFLFDSAPLRLWTGYGERTVSGETYIGGGHIISFSGLEEVADMSATSFEIVLSGINQSIISLALQEPWQNRQCTVYVGEMSVSSVAVLGRGYIDKMPMEDNAETATIKAVIESPLVRGERSSNWRYTDESHKSRYPNDTFFSYVAAIQDVQIPWGRKSD